MRATLAVVVLLAGCSAPPRPEPPPRQPPPQPVDGGWQRLAPAPTRRTEVTATARDGHIVVVGGYRADGSTVSTVETLDTSTGVWSRGPDLPLPVNHAMSATVDGRVYVFGGNLGTNRPSDTAFVLDGAEWRPLAPLPQPRAAATAVAVGTVVYVAGGVGPVGLAAETLVYDTTADAWSTAPGPPTRREHLGGAGFGGLVYTVGGRTGGLDTNLAAFEAYDPGTGRWIRLPDLPTARGGLAATAAAACGGLVVAIGGEGKATFGAAEVFNIESRTWKALPPLPTPRHGLGVVAVGRSVHAVAGGPQPGLHVADTTESIELREPCG